MSRRSRAVGRPPMMSRSGGRIIASRPAAAARSLRSRISAASAPRQRDHQCGRVVRLGHVVDVLPGAPHRHALDPQALLALVVIEQGHREVPAARVPDHAPQQAPPGLAGSEHDHPPVVRATAGLAGAPAAHQEPAGEHHGQGDGTGDQRHRAGDRVEGREQGPGEGGDAGERHGPADVGRLLERAPLVAHPVRPEAPRWSRAGRPRRRRTPAWRGRARARRRGRTGARPHRRWRRTR